VPPILVFHMGQQPSQIFFRLFARFAPFKEVGEALMKGFKGRDPVVQLVESLVRLSSYFLPWIRQSYAPYTPCRVIPSRL